MDSAGRRLLVRRARRVTGPVARATTRKRTGDEQYSGHLGISEQARARRHRRARQGKHRAPPRRADRPAGRPVMRLAFFVAHAGRRYSPVDAVRPSGVCRGDDLVGVVTGQDHHTWVVREQPAHRGASSFPRSTSRWSNTRSGGSPSFARASSSRARSGMGARHALSGVSAR